MTHLILFDRMATSLEHTTTALVNVSDFRIKLSRIGKIFAILGLSMFCPQERHIALMPADLKFSHDFAPPQKRHMNKGFCSYCPTTCFTAHCMFSIDFSLTFETIYLFDHDYVTDSECVEFKNYNSLMNRILIMLQF